MRVLLMNHFPLHGSGTGTYTHDLATALVEAGHEVECLIVDRQERAEQPFHVERVTCRAGDARADLPFDFPCFTAHPESSVNFHDLTDSQLSAYRDALRRRLDPMVDRFNPHIIHGQHVWIQGHLALETGVPYVLTAQGTDLMGYRDEPRCRPLAEQAAENAGRIMAASEFIRRQVLETFELAADRVETVYSAIDTRPYLEAPLDRAEALLRFGLPADCRHLVLFAGKLVPFKGVDTLLNAAAIYEMDPARIHTVIAGDGVQRAELEAQAQRLRLKRVHFLGDLDRASCAALYHLADVVAMPSRGEPLGLVALEAMAAATPVVATDAGGLAEIITREVGGLAPVDDHELLAELLLEAVCLDWKAKKGPAARRHVLERHGFQAWAARIEAVYRQVLKERFGGDCWERA